MHRREFVKTAGAALAVAATGINAASPLPGKITARQVVERIQKKAAENGVEWNTSGRKFGNRVVYTVDTFKAGNPDAELTGIATSFMSTLDVLQRAAASGKNFIISHEPTFWNHMDVTENLKDDPVFRAKMDFIEANNLVIWRFHDHQHSLKPDPIFVGYHRQLGWERYLGGDRRSVYEIPEMTFEDVARHFQNRFGSNSMRMIGDPAMKVRTVGMAGHDISSTMRVAPALDVTVIPEGFEWDSVEYMRDMVDAGQKKGLILLAHEVCEEWGMEDCAVWLREFVPEVPVEWISSREPFWTPVLPNQI